MRVRRGKGRLLVGVIALAALALPAGASATTFCVPDASVPGCPAGATIPANLEAAMSSDASDGIADTVLVGDFDYLDANTLELAGGTDPLEVRGLSPAQSTISTTTIENRFVVDLSGSNRLVTLRDLTIIAPTSLPNGPGFGAGIQTKDDTLENVDIDVRNDNASAIASIIGNGTFRDGEIRATGAGVDILRAIDGTSSAGTVDIERYVVRNSVDAIFNDDAAKTYNVRRTRIVNPTTSAILGAAGTTNVENTVITNTNSVTPVIAFVNSANSAVVNVDHLTAVGANVNTPAFDATVNGAAAGNATMTVSNSIARGFQSGHRRQAPVNAATGNANLTIDHSNLPSSGTNAGDGTLDVATGNIDADPLFTSASDFHLTAGSPSIDAGDPAQAAPTEDFDGNARPLDGDGNGSAVRDQGAYEAPTVPQPDADGDGIPNVSDGCPNEAGPASNNGCPEPAPSDADGDGVADAADACPAQAGPATNGGCPVAEPPKDSRAPQTTITNGPKAETSSTKAKFKFASDEAGSRFECKLDKGKFRSCASPKRYKKLDEGKHKFLVVAIDAAGNRDTSAAKHKWRVEK